MCTHKFGNFQVIYVFQFKGKKISGSQGNRITIHTLVFLSESESGTLNHVFPLHTY